MARLLLVLHPLDQHKIFGRRMQGDTAMVSRGLLRALPITIAALFVLEGPRCCGQTQKPLDVPCRTSWKAHRGMISSLSVSLDGNTLVTCSHDDGSVRFWDVSSGKELRHFDQESRDGKAKIWDEVSPSQRRLIKEVPVDDYVPWFDLSASGNKRRRNLKAHRHVPMKYPLHFSSALLPDNHRAVLAIGDLFTVCPSQALIYDLESGDTKTVYTSGRKDSLNFRQISGMRLTHNLETMAYSESAYDNSMNPLNLASVRKSVNNYIYLYDLNTYKNTMSLKDDSGGLGFGQISFSRDDEIMSNVAWSHLFSRNRRERCGRITLWNLRTGGRIARVQTEGRKVYQATFAPNGRDLAIVGSMYGNAIYIASLKTFKIIKTLSEFQRKTGLDHIAIKELHYTPDGKFLVASNAVGMAVFWDTRDYREVLWAQLNKVGYISFAFTSDGKAMLATPQGGSSLTYDPAGGAKVSFSQRGSDDGSIKVWDVQDFIERMSKAE